MTQPKRIANRYEILEHINQGSMGIVYRVHDQLTGNILALKQVFIPQAPSSSFNELTPISSLSTPDALRIAVTKEFQTLASLRHPNIISVLDYGFDDQGQPYFTMPLLENAQTITKAGWNVPLPVQAGYIVQTLQAPEDIEALSHSMLGETGTQPHVLQLLQAETEGNAFFLVETVRVLAEEAGALDNVGKMTLPETVFAGGVQQVILRRLRRVPETDRPLLKLAALAGRALDLAVLKNARPEVDLDSWLQACINVAVLEVRENNYQFAHDKLREMLIANLTVDERILFNSQIAQALEKTYPTDPACAGRLSAHWLATGDTSKAAYYAEAAGKYAATHFANEEAVQFFSQALELIPEANTHKRFTLLLAREKLYHLQGIRDLQSQDLAWLEKLVESMGNNEKAEVALRKSNYALVTSDYSTAMQAAEAAINLAQDAPTQATGYLRWGRGFWRAGDNEKAFIQLSKALEIAETAHLYELMGDVYRLLALIPRHVNTHEEIAQNMERALHAYRDPRVQDRSGEAWALNNLGATAYYQGFYASSQAFLEASVVIFQKIGDKRGEGQALYNIGHLFWILGVYDQAREYFNQALKTWQESGNRRGESSAYRGLGMVAHHEGDYQESLYHHQKSLDISTKINHRQGEGLTLSFLGHTLEALEQIPEAIHAYQRSLKLWSELDVPGVFPDTRAGLARIYLRLGELQQARAQIDKILDALATRELVFPEELFRIYLTCYLVLLATHDPGAQDFFKWTYHELQKHAASTQDEHLCQSFLNNVHWNRTIISLWESKQHG